jgi:hypothetical protein
MKAPRPYLLLCIPLLVYILSYLYLAWYHGKILIFNTIVHEGGTYTLLKVIFYASHFLGHIPVHTVLAFLFMGSFFFFTGYHLPAHSSRKTAVLAGSLALFLAGSFVLSLAVFGARDTLEFIAQKKQQASGMYIQGGSWNLHLPSSQLLFFFVPVYVYIVLKIFKTNINLHYGGVYWMAFGGALFFVFTFVFNLGTLVPVVSVWKDPRYLAHSVRELATFPLIYFPLPLYFILKIKKDPSGKTGSGRTGKLEICIAVLAVLFLVGLFHQILRSLSAGIGGMAQKPSFAGGGSLGIPHLLSAHYFEHFLDTIYFTLLCLIFYGLAGRMYGKSERAGVS